MSRETDQLKAIHLAEWFRYKGCKAVTINEQGGVFYVYYTLQRDIKPQPPASVLHGTVVFPLGSQEDVVMSYLKGK